MTIPSQQTPPNQSAFASFSAEIRALVEAKLDRLLPPEVEQPEIVHAAMRWSVFAGGKRFRPLLLFAAGRTFGAADSDLSATACALEMIHTYSLIHDDLPSMDNDDLRRGKPTCHVRFGEAMAILAGDALQTLAFQTIAEDANLSLDVRLRLITEISHAAGTPAGMVAGQAFDLAGENRAVSADELEQIHRLKTGALITAAARSGAIIAKANEAELAAVTSYASDLGLLFQITDDILDVTATAEHLGKTPGKDARSQKATYPAVHGIDAARTRADSVHRNACSHLQQISRSTEYLRAIAGYILQRTT